MYAYSKESASINYYISQQYKRFAETPPKTNQEFEHKIDLLDAEESSRSNIDTQHHITEKEKRFGMRAALRNFQRECSGCGQVPITMKPSNCEICGKF
jgi:mobilome CxxCx(11)CxxC protein